MQSLQDAEPGAVGPYALLGRIGAGGMGRVYLGRSPGGRPVAVKVVRPELAGQPGFRERFRREVAAARQVSGAYTAPVLDADPEAPTPWMATAYIAGPSLQQAVDAHGPLDPAAVARLGAALAEALAAIHALGQVHRDLKPGNILLAADGPRVIDFGIARVLDDSVLSAAGQVAGTAGYQAPEQAEGEQVGPAADVFALGAVLAFAAAGRPPFGTGPAAVLMYRAAHEAPDLSGLPADLARIMADCLAKPPADRPSARDLLARFPSVQASGNWTLPQPILRDIEHREATLAETFAVTRVRPPKRRTLLLGGLGAAGAAVLTAGGGAAIWEAQRRPSRSKAARTSTGKGPRFPALHHAWSANGVTGARRPFVLGHTLFSGAGTSITPGVNATDVRDGKFMWGQGSIGPLWGDAAGVVDRTTLYAMSNLYIVAYTIDTGDGTWGWRDQTSNTTFAPQFAVGGSLICTAENGEALALDLRRRRPRWRRKLYSPPTGADLVTGVAWPAGRLFYLGDASTGSVLAFDTATGARRWTAPQVAGPTTLLAGGLLFVGGPSRRLAALDARTGAVRWTSDHHASSLTVHDGRLIVAGDGLHALDPATGAAHWSSDHLVPDNGVATVARGVVAYVSDQQVHGVDPATGRPIASHPVPTLTGRNAVAVAFGDLLILGNDRALIALSFTA